MYLAVSIRRTKSIHSSLQSTIHPMSSAWSGNSTVFHIPWLFSPTTPNRKARMRPSFLPCLRLLAHWSYSARVIAVSRTSGAGSTAALGRDVPSGTRVTKAVTVALQYWNYPEPTICFYVALSIIWIRSGEIHWYLGLYCRPKFWAIYP